MRSHCQKGCTMIRALTFALCCSALSAQVPMPNPQQTPGKANPALTKAILCSPGFHTKPYRHVSASEKRAACAAYGIFKGCPGRGYEIDHLIPLELGGSNDMLNLWPQPASRRGVVGYQDKDALENHLHRMVCSGEISLGGAQSRIAHDWYHLWLAPPDSTGGII